MIIKPSIRQLANYPYLPFLAQQLSQKYHSKTVNYYDLKEIGSILWRCLEVKTDLIPQALIIDCCHPLLSAIPWECLYHPQQGFLAKHPNYTLSRRICNIQPISIIPTAPLKILLWTAQPKNMTSVQTRLDIEIEQQVIYKSLQTFIEKNIIHFYAPHEGSFEQFNKILVAETWDVVILSGHSILKKYESADIAFFVFEDEEQNEALISAQTLSTAFQKSKVQCIIIAACQSGQILTTSNLIKPLIQIGIPNVIGIRESLIDKASIIFVQTFCLALAERKPIDVAVQQARCAIISLLANNEIWLETAESHKIEQLQWCLPIFYSHNPTQILFNNPQNITSPPNIIGHQLSKSDLFIGRRQELRNLSRILTTNSALVIYGLVGSGKTALAKQLAITLMQQKYRLFFYQANKQSNFSDFLLQKLKLTKNIKLETILKSHFAQDEWLIWLDDLQYAPADKTIQNLFIQLQTWQPSNLRLLITARSPFINIESCYKYRIQLPNFNDFTHYMRYLGLNYPFLQQLKIYQLLNGNFRGLQLLQSMPLQLEMSKLIRQLGIIRRYLFASKT